MAEKLGMNDSALKTAVHRFRAQFREYLKQEVAQTVSGPGEIEDELRYLRSVLGNERAP
jgi:RNA polymerase sigma-70 factor (ECF subfamily)